VTKPRGAEQEIRYPDSSPPPTTTDAELLADAEGVLRAVEWAGKWVHNYCATCPYCGGSQKEHGRLEPTVGHAPGCELYRVLGRLAARREGARNGA
jgi:hypothetical protein